MDRGFPLTRLRQCGWASGCVGLRRGPPPTHACLLSVPPTGLGLGGYWDRILYLPVSASGPLGLALAPNWRRGLCGCRHALYRAWGAQRLLQTAWCGPIPDDGNLPDCPVPAGELAAIIHRMRDALTPSVALAVAPPPRPPRRSGGTRPKAGAAEAARPVGAPGQAALEDMWPLRVMGVGGPLAGDEGEILDPLAPYGA